VEFPGIDALHGCLFVLSLVRVYYVETQDLWLIHHCSPPEAGRAYLAGDWGRGMLSYSAMATSWTLNPVLPQIGAIAALALALPLALALNPIISRHQGLLKLRQFPVSLLGDGRISSSRSMPKPR
jgi:hypothetical protein